MAAQRYVSRELTHFVGRGLRDKVTVPVDLQEQQFSLLIKILRQGELGKLHSGTGGYATLFSSKGGAASLSSNERYSGTMVCFCDIPVTDLSIHMRKYSEFGLAFAKRFLVGKGASPVFYVSRDSLVTNSVPGKAGNRLLPLKDVFDLYDAEWARLLSVVYADLKKNPGPGAWSTLVMNLGFQQEHLLHAQLKFFDSNHDEDHLENFYMEREWRVWGTVPFALADVCRVIIPETFSKRLRQEMPDYYGQVTFSQHE